MNSWAPSRIYWVRHERHGNGESVFWTEAFLCDIPALHWKAMLFKASRLLFLSLGFLELKEWVSLADEVGPYPETSCEMLFTPIIEHRWVHYKGKKEDNKKARFHLQKQLAFETQTQCSLPVSLLLFVFFLRIKSCSFRNNVKHENKTEFCLHLCI